jgi:hypothetical protein
MKLILGSLSLALLAVGCMNQREYMDPTQNSGLTGSVSNMAVRDGNLRGDFGPRRGFDGEATDMQGSSDYEFKSSNVNVAREENGRGAGMVILWTNGKTLEQLDLGRHDFEYDENSLDQGEISANVCSGSAPGSYDYDQPADKGHIVISDNPQGGREVAVHTETHRLDPVTGARTDNLEVSDTSFTFVPGGEQQTEQ